MKANVAININPFQVPQSVTALAFTNSLPPAPPQPWKGIEPPSAPPGPFTVPLSELDPATLEQLCDDFRTRVFELAGKQRPDGLSRTVAPIDALELIQGFIGNEPPVAVDEALDRIRDYLGDF